MCVFMHSEVDSSVIGLNNKYLTAEIRQFVFVAMDSLFPRVALCGTIFYIFSPLWSLWSAYKLIMLQLILILYV